MNTPTDVVERARRTYNAAADHFDHPVNSHWERFGRRTVERLRLAPGERVLDVCSGTGASALPAAELVGPEGSVVAVDLAETILDAARAKAAARGLGNVEFRVGDMMALGEPDACFDAVVCVFGIFFVPDLPAACRELWRMVKPGGRLALTTWGPDSFEPLESTFWNAVERLRPDLGQRWSPWDDLTDPELVRAELAGVGIEAEVVLEEGTHPLSGPEDVWPLLQGSGFRGTLDRLEVGERDAVRRECEALVRDGVERLEATVVFAVGKKG